jgi:hypothetical protein
MLERSYIPAHRWKALAELSVMQAAAELGPGKAVLYGSQALNTYIDPMFEFTPSDVDLLVVVDTAEEFHGLIGAFTERVRVHLGRNSNQQSAPAMDVPIYNFHGNDVTVKLCLKGVHIADITRQFSKAAADVQRVYPRCTVDVQYEDTQQCVLTVVSMAESLHRLQATLSGGPCIDSSFIPAVEDNCWRIAKDSKRLARLLYLQAHGLLSATPRPITAYNFNVSPAAYVFVAEPQKADISNLQRESTRLEMAVQVAQCEVTPVSKKWSRPPLRFSGFRQSVAVELAAFKTFLEDASSKILHRTKNYVDASTKVRKRVQHVLDLQQTRASKMVKERDARLQVAGHTIHELLSVLVKKHVELVDYHKAATAVFNDIGINLRQLQKLTVGDRCLGNLYKEYSTLFKELHASGVASIEPPSMEDADLDCMSFVTKQCAGILTSGVTRAAALSNEGIVYARTTTTGYSVMSSRQKSDRLDVDWQVHALTCVATTLVTALTTPLSTKLELLFMHVVALNARWEAAAEMLATHTVSEQFDLQYLRKVDQVRLSCFS